MTLTQEVGLIYSSDFVKVLPIPFPALSSSQSVLTHMALLAERDGQIRGTYIRSFLALCILCGC